LSGPYYDVNNDGACTATDILSVVTHVNAQTVPLAEEEDRRALIVRRSDLPLTSIPVAEDAFDWDDEDPIFMELDPVLTDLADELVRR
jgi:hypothetical protein